jgi:hypothetical protein
MMRFRRDALVIAEEDIAWVGVGMKHTVQKHLLQIGFEQVLCKFGAVEFQACERADLEVPGRKFHARFLRTWNHGQSSLAAAPASKPTP